MSKGPCSIDGCVRAVYARGWCSRHYKRWHAHGDPLGGRPTYATARVEDDPTGAARLAQKAVRDGDCLRWAGAHQTNGYGMLRLGGKARYAHRVAYELAKGPIPRGLEIDHLCRVRDCINPDHLEAVTHAENLARSRAARKGDDS